MKPGCDRIPEDQEEEQHRLYMLLFELGKAPVDVGGLLMCAIHRRPLIECNDEMDNRGKL